MHLDLENIEEKFAETVGSVLWHKLDKMFKVAERVFIVGNGGLYSTANHLGDDANRLLFKAGVKKTIFSPDSVCFITSVANDYGYNNVFVKWLQTHYLDRDCLVIGLSCSGSSKNVISALTFAREHHAKVALISGQTANILPDDELEICLGTTYFHTTEILSLILFYELIASSGGKCPTIKEEVMRKACSSHISREGEFK